MRKRHFTVFPKPLLTRLEQSRPSLALEHSVLDAAKLPIEELLKQLETTTHGLSASQAKDRLATFGMNVLAKDQQAGIGKLLLHAIVNPLVVLLSVLATISFATGDSRAGTMMFLMIVLGVGLKLFQEGRASRAAMQLKSLISVQANVLRDGQWCELPISNLVPGDIVQIAAGDMIPADLRLMSVKDLFVNQSSLTGESFPVEKFEREHHALTGTPIELTSIAFLGTNVESGTATGVIVETGSRTYLGSLAKSLTETIPPTAFDRGITRFTWLMLRFVIVLIVAVFLINGLLRGNWSEAFFFAIAVAVGLTPEMLPMIVTVCLSKGAIELSKRKVIVKHINSIQNLGAIDVLCTDKTGTLTMDHVLLERYCDVKLRPDDEVLKLAYVNSYFQTGLKNVLDRAVLAHQEPRVFAHVAEYQKVDEIPFDFQRRIMSVVVRHRDGSEILVSKGAPEAIFPKCKQFELTGEILPMDGEHVSALQQEYERLSAEGFRVLAIATSELRSAGSEHLAHHTYTKDDEENLTLRGYVAFLDPPKESAGQAISALIKNGVQVKVVTGDNDLVARKICHEVGLDLQSVLLGSQVEKMSDQELAEIVIKTTLFARVSPTHKERIIRALQANQHIVGFMGDGINDAPALRAADVGISVDTAVDIAKESADMILLEKSLLVLEAGVIEGRKVFANIMKYVRMGASSNFGNMFSVLGASVFVPFLPMAPIQILANNLLYDISQTAIPTDNVDPEQIEKPKPWNMAQLTRFILCIGPCSSLFDYTTFFMMLYLFGCWDVSTPEAALKSQSLFQTGWFVESLITQSIIIHIIRTNRIPFLNSIASWPLLATSTAVILFGAVLPFSPLGSYLGFTSLPSLFWPLLCATVLCYALLTQWMKTWLVSRQWI